MDFQSVALKSGNANAGTFTSFSTAASRIANLNGRLYAEQSARSTTGFWSYSWTAPTSGTGNVTFYSVGLAVNGSGTNGDQSTAGMSLALTERPTINYSLDEYCQNDSDPLPTTTGSSTGTYSIAPTSAVINSSNGQIDLSASTSRNLYCDLQLWLWNHYGSSDH